MEEREIDKILRPEKKLIFLLIAFLGIAFLCIGLVFHFKFKEKKEPVDFTELIFNGTEQEGQYVEIDIAYLPIILKTTNDRDYYFYYAEDEQKKCVFSKII